MLCKTLKAYVSQQGTDYIGNWFNGLTPKAQARLSAILSNLVNLKIWKYPPYKKLTDCEGLGEIVMEVQNVQYRLIGMWGPAKHEFTFLIGCTHKEDDYDPRDCLMTAVKRKRYIQSNIGELREYP